MSDIKVGDLVIVVKSPCSHGDKDVGRIFTVSLLQHDHMHCRYCGWESPPQWCVEDPLVRGSGFLVSWLKRIPPLEELERTQIVEELTI